MTRILVAISTRSESARFTDFFRSLHNIDTSGLDVKIKLYLGWHSYENKNNAVRDAIHEGYEYIFFVDDDQMFPPNILKKLLEANKDIISCNLLNRTPPFHPYLFANADENGRGNPIELNGSGIIEIDGCGIGGVLVKTNVFIKVPPFAVDEHVGTEDLYFCREARKVGYKIYVDLEAPSGHMCIAAIWPIRDENSEWATAVMLNHTLQIKLPKAKRVDDSHMTIPGSKHI